MTKNEGVDVSVVVVNYNTHDLLPSFFEHLNKATKNLRVQVIVIDNASSDNSNGYLRKYSSNFDLVFNKSNVGFGRANNQSLPISLGRYMLLLNTDAFVEPCSIEKTVEYLDDNPSYAVLGVRLIGRDGTLQPSCRYFPTPWNEFLVKTGLTRFFPSTRVVDDMNWDHSTTRECDWVPGCYYLLRKTVIDQVGLFDPRFFLYYEEVDHCQTIKSMGWKVIFYPDTTVMHIGGESAKSESTLTEGGRQISSLQIESELLYFRKHHGLVGVWLSIGLNAVASLILSSKWLIRRRRFRGVGVYWQEQLTRWMIFRRTSWATRPTR